LFEDITFDDELQAEAEKENRYKTSDFKYYLLVLAFIGLGTIIINKYSK
tara:strand:+ start:681 stop:827 length:147 start_codon:yes stop_codon:yes gene_type:complete